MKTFPINLLIAHQIIAENYKNVGQKVKIWPFKISEPSKICIYDTKPLILRDYRILVGKLYNNGQHKKIID